MTIEAGAIAGILAESLKLLNFLLTNKVAQGKITQEKKDALIKEARDAIKVRDYDRFFIVLRRARRL